MTSRITLTGLALALAACAQISGSHISIDGHPYEPYQQVQGMVGVMAVDAEPVLLNSTLGSIVEDDEPTQGVLGAAVMTPIAGRRVEIGGEAGATYGSSVEGGLIDNGSAIVPSDNEVILSDFFIGMYLNAFVNDRMRVYVSGGPVLQYGRLDYEFRDAGGRRVSVGDTGFGGGVYARAGIEVEVRSGQFAGFSARWIDSSVNLGGGLSDYDFEAWQFLFTMTSGF